MLSNMPREDGLVKTENIREEESLTKPAALLPKITTHFTIELIIDTVCPHCYIGLKNLYAAIEIHKTRHPEATFELVCSPLILYPSALRSAHNKITYYTRTHGAQGSLFETWTRLGATVGIGFSWRGRTGNTRDSHKLLRFALESIPTTMPSTKFAQQPQQRAATSPTTMTNATTETSSLRRGPALQMRLLEAIFRGYFEYDRDVSDQGFLVEVGTSVGAGVFTATDVREVLESENWGLAIDILSAKARARLKVDAVPTVIVNGLSLYGGWQQPELFVAEFERLRLGIPRDVSGGDGSGCSHCMAVGARY
ncbi:thioredoxin-like protein [Biscogniauxia marginata]|nr:thioredoxin-like protein [Biscogniauxia marginata]